MRDLINSGSLRSAGYFVLAALAIVAAWRERTCDDRERLQLWPRYWVFTALLLLTVGVAHAGHLGEILAGLGRSQARAAGWYDARRKVQALAVLSVTVGWCVTVLVAIWRVPPRRRRYLPSAIAVFTLIAFIAMRVISLHQIDAVLYRRGVRGVRFVALVELTLLAVAGASILARWRPTSMPTSSHPVERIDVRQ
jgi:hypothetical protein